MIRTWIANIQPLYEECKYQSYYRQLPNFRREKADRLFFHRDRAQSVGVWTLLEVVRNKCNVDERAVYNLSHSGDYVVCSLDVDCRKQTQLGCDIEIMGSADIKIAQRFFCDSEYRTILNRENKTLQKEAFYRFWVLKESFMKATRKGMGLDMKNFEIELSSPPALIRQPACFSQKYYFKEYKVSGIPYKVAVCSTEDEIDSEIQMELKL